MSLKECSTECLTDSQLRCLETKMIPAKADIRWISSIMKSTWNVASQFHQSHLSLIPKIAGRFCKLYQNLHQGNTLNWTQEPSINKHCSSRTRVQSYSILRKPVLKNVTFPKDSPDRPTDWSTNKQTNQLADRLYPAWKIYKIVRTLCPSTL